MGMRYDSIGLVEKQGAEQHTTEDWNRIPTHVLDAGGISLVNGAASMMPAANASAASRARSDGFRKTSTSEAPSRFIVAIITPPERPEDWI
jgi:hypothetical protein